MPNVIKTKCGEIRGTTCQWEGVTAYKGIRYATAERWKYPEMITHWDGIYEAAEYGNCSYQPRAFYDESKMPEKAFYYNEFRKGETYTYSDDCLFLNVFTPETATEESNLPVIVYIHGGGYTGGCGHEKHFNAPVWPTKDVIGVTINYRLGPMGFMCLPELEAESGHTGNYGLYDQMTALRWVKENIKEFGGNPENITVMGQSAGAMSVLNHCISPLTDGLFAKAVMNSGGGVHKLMNSNATAKDRFVFWQKVMADADCMSLEELRALDAEKLFASFQKVKKATKGAGMIASPCIDGEFLTESGLSVTAKGEQKDIPYMMGSTSHDIVPPIVQGMAKEWCLKQAEQKKQPSYCWFFDRMLPGDDNGAWHSSELWYFFGTLDNCWRPFSAHDEKLSEAMVDALCNFAKTGNPNKEGRDTWKPVTSSKDDILIWGEKMPRMGKPSKMKLWKTMFTNKAVGE